MVKCKDILSFLEEIAPVERKMDFDSVGLLAGEADAPVTKVLLALDITEEVIAEAESLGAELIVSHHPLFFSLRSVNDRDYNGRRVVQLLRRGMNAICMHTNLDAADDGVNDALARALGLTDISMLHVDGVDSQGVSYGIGRIGTLKEEMELEHFLPFVKEVLGCNGIRYVSGGKKVRRIAVMGGSGGDDYPYALNCGCDTYVTADVKYHVFLEAKANGLNLLDAGHFPTENVIIPHLYSLLSCRFSEVSFNISRRLHQTEQFFG